MVFDRVCFSSTICEVIRTISILFLGKDFDRKKKKNSQANFN